MIRYLGLIILYLLLGMSIGAFEWFFYRPFIENMTDKLFSFERIRHKGILHNFAETVTGMLNTMGIIIFLIPMAYLLWAPKNLPLNLGVPNLICAFALFIGYIIAIDLKSYLDARKFTSAAVIASLGTSRKLKRVIGNGIDVNEPHIDGRTALMFGGSNFKVENVRLLIEAGANIRAIDHVGNTALIWASVIGNIRILQMLIDAGSDINAKNHKGETALDIASS